MDEPLGRVTVVLYPDGYVSVELDAKVTAPEHLRRAADTLSRLAGTAERERRPVDCPVCGQEVRAISAKRNGDYQISPCGHSF